MNKILLKKVKKIKKLSPESSNIEEQKPTEIEQNLTEEKQNFTEEKQNLIEEIHKSTDEEQTPTLLDSVSSKSKEDKENNTEKKNEEKDENEDGKKDENEDEISDVIKNLPEFVHYLETIISNATDILNNAYSDEYPRELQNRLNRKVTELLILQKEIKAIYENIESFNMQIKAVKINVNDHRKQLRLAKLKERRKKFKLYNEKKKLNESASNKELIRLTTTQSVTTFTLPSPAENSMTMLRRMSTVPISADCRRSLYSRFRENIRSRREQNQIQVQNRTNTESNTPGVVVHLSQIESNEVNNSNNNDNENKACRTCLRENNETNYLFDFDVISQKSFAEIIMTVSNLKIEFEDELPKQICKLCTTNVLNLYNFKQQVEQNELFLLNYIKKNKINYLTNNDDHIEIKVESDENDLNESLTNFEDFAPEYCNVDVNLSDDLPDKSNFYDEIDEINDKENSENYNTSQTNKNIENIEYSKKAKNENVSCKICGKSFGSKRSYAAHLAIHKKANKYGCAHCTQKFGRKDYLQSHMKMVHGVYLENPECKVCEQKFANRSSYRRHLISKLHKMFIEEHKKEKLKPENLNETNKNFEDHENHTEYEKIDIEMKKPLLNFECVDTKISNSNKEDNLIGFEVDSYNEFPVNSVTENNCKDIKVKNKNPSENISEIDIKEYDPKFSQECVAKVKEIFLCKICGKTFCTKRSYRSHLIFHINANNYACTHCEKQFIRKDSLQSHLIIHGVFPKLPMCIICNLKFNSSIKLKRHLLSNNHKLRTKKLEINQLEGKNLEEIDNYHQKNSTNAKKIESTFKMVKNKKKLEGKNLEESDHNFQQDSTNSIDNNIVNKKEELMSKSLQGLDSDDEHDSTDEEYTKKSFIKIKQKSKLKCRLCGDLFDSYRLLDQHIEKHNLGKDKKFECQICFKKFYVENNYQLHKVIHNDLNKTNSSTEHNDKVCFICKKYFPRDIRKHMRIHDREDNYGFNYKATPKIECSKCSKILNSKSSLSKHLKTDCSKPIQINQNFAKHLCPFCGRNYSSSFSLKIHITRHTGEKSHKCNICERSFSLSYELKKHLLKHSQKSTVLCPECGKEFLTAKQLSRHLKLHSKIRPFKCAYCPKAYKISSHLKLHGRLHIGEQDIRAFKCTHCPKAFKQLFHLKLHLRCHK